MLVQPPPSWVRPGLRQLRRAPGALILSPPPTGGVGSNDLVAPDLPLSKPSLAAPPITGATWTPMTSAELTTALNNSARGDVIRLQPGVTYVAPSIDGFRIPAKTGTGWLTITLTEAGEAALPAIQADGKCDVAGANARVGWSHYNDGKLAILEANHGTGSQYGICLYTEAGCDYVYIRGVACVSQAFGSASTISTYPLLLVGSYGSGAPTAGIVSSFEDIPEHIILQQCYAENPFDGQYKRTVEFHCNEGGIANSTFICRSTSHNETNALWFANCAGPQHHFNSAFIAAGINWFCGGVDLSSSYMAGKQPSDITVDSCWFYTPEEWIRDTPAYVALGAAAKFQNCKNSQEFKSGIRVLIENCIWEGSSIGSTSGGKSHFGQNGQTLTLKVLTEAGYSYPTRPIPVEFRGHMYWMEVAHVTVRFNWSFKAGSGFDVMGVQSTEYAGVAVPTNHVLIHDNIIDVEESANGYYGSNRHLFTTPNSTIDGQSLISSYWEFRHNTCLGSTADKTYLAGGPVPFSMHDNVHMYAWDDYNGIYGIAGSIGGVTKIGKEVLDAYCPTAHNNAWIGESASRYLGYGTTNGGTNYLGGSDASYGVNADGSLAVGSSLLTADSEGGRVGADHAAVMAAVAGVRQTTQLPVWP